MKKLELTGLFFIFFTMVQAQTKNSSWLKHQLRSNASPLLTKVLNQPDTFRYQIIYTKIDRDRKNSPKFANFYLNVNEDSYFYPASMVKLPTALAALEKISALKDKGIDKYTAMLTDSSYTVQTAVNADATSATRLPSIDHYIKKIFVVSDNDAYNRLYEFCGQQYLNETLWKKGYKNMRITRRFVKMTAEENRHTNAIRFQKEGKTVYTQEPATSNATFDFSREILIGKAHLDQDDQLVNAPYDFTTHNKATLTDLQQMMQSVLFPGSVPESRQFNLTADDYKNLYQYMSEKPSESRFPSYDTTAFFDSYTKFFFFRDGKQKIPDHIRSFNKTGWSHGFLTDVCYIVDFKNNLEFMLSACIYVNEDQVLNDNKYEYIETGYPFFREVGKKIYEYELNRKRKVVPDLNKWKLMYD
ncbi:serine hydrolase [Niabella yanshanensis]|uniref:Serine hydrolase n=1 Tax=Niabella yanshanensis TaxID=577386 RepID=A0ABZ0W0M2_9BACT|nr:serine hydrolase [Niabella yanshanensis]WQD36711.1 serine hydrolase [Niabella yanshanensis]